MIDACGPAHGNRPQRRAVHGEWPVIVVRLLYRCAVHRMMRGRRHGPGSSAIRASLDCIKVLRTIDKPAFQPSLPQLNSGFPRAD
jgi:hypothetical protein